MCPRLIRYTIEIQHCMETTIIASSPEEARMKLIEDESLWSDDFVGGATIHDSIKEEDISL